MSTHQKKRLLIIGLDGFTWRVGKRLTGEGHMPILADLLAQGSHGHLKSVTPNETSPAWSSFQTGCTPAKTGVFAFHSFSRQTRHIRLNSSRDIKVPTLWELLSAAGKRIVSINMPMTSPPPPINGVIIPGLTCPKLSCETVHPPELFEKYIASNPDYLIVNNQPQPDLCSGVAQAVKTEDTRCRLAVKLMREIEWDVFSVQIQSTDVFQHRYWWAIDPDARGYTEEAYTQAVEFYKSIDSILGRLIEAAGQSVLTVVVSDHGFCAKKAEIGLNTWLAQNGYLHLNVPEKSNVLKDIKNKIKKAVPVIKYLAGVYGKSIRFFYDRISSTREKKSALYSEKVVKHIRETINMDRTFAFCLGGMAGLLYLMDRTQKDKTARMIQELLEAYGPASSDPLISDIQPMAHFCKDADDNYPDYIITYLPGVEGRISPEGPSVVSSGVINGKQSGTHEPEGIMVLHGPDIKFGSTVNATIIDIAPTILVYMDVPIPAYVDGNVLQEAFIEPLKSTFLDTNHPQNSSRQDLSSQDQTAVEKQLRDLGYL